MLGKPAMVLFEILKRERGPVRLNLVAHNGPRSADSARASIVDDTILAAPLLPPVDRQRDSFLRGVGLAQK